LASFILVNMHDLADPIDAAPGILRLAVPNAPAQPFDLVDDHGLCLHPAEIVGRQPACGLRRVLDPHCDVEPIEEGWRRDSGIDKDRPQTGTAVGERGHFGVVGSANGANALSDQRRDVGVGLRHCSEHLPTSARCFDIADAHFQVTFARFTAADERRIHADSDRCCRSCWLVRGCSSKLLADPQRMVAQCLRAPTGVNGQQVLQYARSDAIGR
jgi:hypothetical protein